MYLRYHIFVLILCIHISYFCGHDRYPLVPPAAAKIVFNKIYGSLATFALAKASNLSNYYAAVTEAQRQYLVVLFFHGLSNEAHRDLKKKVHNNALMGLDTIPRTYNKVLQLADQYKSSYQQRQPRSIRGGASPLHRRASWWRRQQWRQPQICHTDSQCLFINGIAFLIILSRKLRLATVEQIPMRTATQLSNS